jgi:ring-1,2-phenylacetyl-CoA epoxidase subunit PaaC
MDPDLKQALSDQLLAAADDELILGHRDSEWTGHAPILEEDIAFANIAQDEIGHAIIWYSLLAELTGQDPDRQVFFRDAEAYRNVQLVELPKGDWAFSMVRQYLFDAAEMVRLAEWVNSHYQPLAEAAAKIRKEEIYHYRHTHTWVKRLGLGTEESHRRTQNALDELWPYAFQLFAALPGQALLIQAGIVPDPCQVRQEWEDKVLPFLKESGLQVPVQPDSAVAPRHQHTGHLAALLAEMQQVARLDPEAQW